MKAHTQFYLDHRNPQWIAASRTDGGALARTVLSTHDEGLVLSRRLAWEVVARTVNSFGRSACEGGIEDQILQAAAESLSQLPNDGFVFTAWVRENDQMTVVSCGTNTVVAVTDSSISEVVQPHNVDLMLRDQGKPSVNPAHKLIATTLLSGASSQRDVRVARVHPGAAILIIADRRAAEALLTARPCAEESSSFVADWTPESGQADNTHVLVAM